jgi:tRNA(fMet)-specific endonuclease VapC
LTVILDTNALSAFAEGDGALGARLQDYESFAVPAVVLGEYRFGVLQSRKREQHEHWLATRLPIVLAVDESTASFYAAIRLELKQIGKPIPVNDLWIAALCRQHGYDILSRDAHFDRVAGLRRISW